MMTENFKLKYFDLIKKNIHKLFDYEWEYKYIAMDDDGFAYAYNVKPYTHKHTWNMPSDNLLCHEQVELFDIEEFDETSWKDTLVKIEDVVKIKREQKGNNMKTDLIGDMLKSMRVLQDAVLLLQKTVIGLRKQAMFQEEIIKKLLEFVDDTTFLTTKNDIQYFNGNAKCYLSEIKNKTYRNQEEIAELCGD